MDKKRKNTLTSYFARINPKNDESRKGNSAPSQNPRTPSLLFQEEGPCKTKSSLITNKPKYIKYTLNVPIMEICRLCATVVAESTSIFSERQGDSLAEMVRFVSAVQIDETDALSCRVCADCVELTIDAFHYVKRVREVDERLRESLAETEVPKQAASGDAADEMPPTNSANEIEFEPPTEPVQNDVQFDIEEISVEYLEEKSAAASKQIISLLIESVNEAGSEKWVKIRRDSLCIGDNGNDDDNEDNASSSEEESSSVYVESEHMKSEPGGENRVVRCCSRKCRLAFRTRDELVEHGSVAHSADRTIAKTEQSSFECVVCFQRFDSRQNLLCHLRRLVRDYRCNLCNSYFDTPHDRTVHITTNHRNPTSARYRLEDQPVKICCGCEANFSTVEDLYQHGIDQHLNQSSFPEVDGGNQCNICFKFFKTKISLRNHQTLVYKPKTYPCRTCGKAFECPSKLANHEPIHRTMRNFVCTTCAGTFKTATDLRGHQRIHQEKSLVCNVCGAKFHKKSHLKSHLKTHDDNAYDYACSLCPRKFKEKSNWKNHLKVHTQEKPFKCEYCPKEFRYATDKKRHEMSHTGNYPHNCAGCGKAFTRGNLLREHLRVCGVKQKEK